MHAAILLYEHISLISAVETASSHQRDNLSELQTPVEKFRSFQSSGEAELGESGHRQRGRALLLQLQPLWFLGLGQPAVVQQAEEVEALAHLGGVGQHVVAADQLLPGGHVAAVPQQDLQRTVNTESAG